MNKLILFEFVAMPREILARYIRACDEETVPENFAVLAEDFDEIADSFEYDALEALRERYADSPSKRAAIAKLLKERTKIENEVVLF